MQPSYVTWYKVPWCVETKQISVYWVSESFIDDNLNVLNIRKITGKSSYGKSGLSTKAQSKSFDTMQHTMKKACFEGTTCWKICMRNEQTNMTSNHWLCCTLSQYHRSIQLHNCAESYWEKPPPTTNRHTHYNPSMDIVISSGEVKCHDMYEVENVYEED